MQKITLLLLVTAALFAPSNLRADDQQAAAEAKMRQVLRDTMMQLRDAQNQVVTLQAAQTQSDKDKTDLQAKVDDLAAKLKDTTDKATLDKTDADKAITEMRKEIDDGNGQIGRLNDGIKQWKQAYEQVSQLATTKENARAQLELRTALLQRTVDDRETKNLALYKLGTEILTRYEKFGLGDAISAKEPFVGVSRVKLENLVQDYKNKLLDQALTTNAKGLPIAPAPQESLPDSKPAAKAAEDAPTQGAPKDSPESNDGNRVTNR